MGSHCEGMAVDVGVDGPFDPDHDEQVMRPAIVGQHELSAGFEVVDLPPDI